MEEISLLFTECARLPARVDGVAFFATFTARHFAVSLSCATRCTYDEVSSKIRRERSNCPDKSPQIHDFTSHVDLSNRLKSLFPQIQIYLICHISLVGMILLKKENIHIKWHIFLCGLFHMRRVSALGRKLILRRINVSGKVCAIVLTNTTRIYRY